MTTLEGSRLRGVSFIGEKFPWESVIRPAYYVAYTFTLSYNPFLPPSYWVCGRRSREISFGPEPHRHPPTDLCYGCSSLAYYICCGPGATSDSFSPDSHQLFGIRGSFFPLSTLHTYYNSKFEKSQLFFCSKISILSSRASICRRS